MNITFSKLIAKRLEQFITTYILNICDMFVWVIGLMITYIKNKWNQKIFCTGSTKDTLYRMYTSRLKFTSVSNLYPNGQNPKLFTITYITHPIRSINSFLRSRVINAATYASVYRRPLPSQWVRLCPTARLPQIQDN